MSRILIGTNNPAKISTFQMLLSEAGYEVITPKQLGIFDEVEETGKTFKENALLKAQFFFDKSGLPTIADDGGIEIDALDGAPGVYSHRWAGEPPTGISIDQHLVDFTLQKLTNVPRGKRTARIIGILCLIQPNEKPIFSTASIEGYITTEQQAPIQVGFPYRSIFFCPQLGKLLALATPEELKKIDHRRESIGNLLPYLP